MKDQSGTNQKLIEENTLLKQRIQELEQSESERKRMAEALTKSEEKFRKAFYTSPDSVNINRLEDGMYISINPGFTRILGYTEEDIIGKTSIEYNIWDNPEDRQRLVARLEKDGEVANLEATFKTKGGDIRDGLMSASVIITPAIKHVNFMRHKQPLDA
ncbi:MAG: PAS domain-containing protein [Deltaproteobacteria bacterium]|nr:PAS domain-containing protein [Deltaproteobacteria bacterium]